MPELQALVHAAGRATDLLEAWRDLPPFPVGLFKRVPVFGGGDVVREFRTRGTSGGGRAMVRHTQDGCTVASAAVRSAVAELLPDRGAGRRILAMYADPRFSPGSDASMAVATMLGDSDVPRSRFVGPADTGDFSSFVEELRSSEVAGPPLLIIGSAPELLRALDRLSSVGMRFRLPPESLVVDIGGVPQGGVLGPYATLTYACDQVLGVRPWQCVDVYKMVEFATPFLENTARDRVDAPRFKVAPPWTRVRAVDPETLAPLPDGRVGLLAVLDLASLDRPCSLVTDDLGLALPEGPGGEGRFLVLGRASADQLRVSTRLVDTVAAALGHGESVR